MGANNMPSTVSNATGHSERESAEAARPAREQKVEGYIVLRRFAYGREDRCYLEGQSIFGLRSVAEAVAVDHSRRFNADCRVVPLVRGVE